MDFLDIQPESISYIIIRKISELFSLNINLLFEKKSDNK
jgi:hypothetical protein